MRKIMGWGILVLLVAITQIFLFNQFGLVNFLTMWATILIVCLFVALLVIAIKLITY